MIKTKLISVFLVLILCFSYVGCTNNKPKDETLVETGINIIENGSTDYKIVISPEAEANVKSAATEMQYFFKLSTEVIMPIITDENITITKDSKYISIGQNAITKHYNFVVSEEDVGTRGFCIKTFDNSVLISGATSIGFGSLYGTYDFLSKVIDYECCDPYYGTYYEQKNVVKLYEFDYSDKPDIEYNLFPSGRADMEGTYAHRMRLESYSDMLMTEFGSVHNFFDYLPPSTYLKDNPKWYDSPTSPSQLCLTAHGDELQYNLLIKTVAEKMISMMDKNPEMVNLAFTEMDVQTWCTCSKCSSEKNKYGGNSAVCVKMCNDLAEYIENHYNALNIDREFYIYFFVYMLTEDAPVKKVNDNYVGIDDSVYCNEHVVPWIGTMYTQFRLVDFYDERNANAARLIEQWNALSGKIAVWEYCVSFVNLLIPYNTMTSIPNSFKFFKDNNTVLLINNAGYVSNNTAFEGVRRYLTSKYSWDVNADYNELIDNYFSKCYGRAGDIMKQYYNDWVVRCQYVLDNNGIRINDVVCPREEDYPYALLKQWISYLDEATAIINKYYDEKESANYIKAIDTERVSLYYLMVELHSDKFSDADLLNLKKEFKSICLKVGITNINGNDSLSTVYAKWGI